MIDSLKKIYKLFPRKIQLKFGVLLFMMFFASIFELVGIGMIPAFVVAIAQPERIFAIPYVGPMLMDLGITTSTSLAYAGAVVLISVYVIKNLYLTTYQYLKEKFVQRQKIFLSNRIFKAYMTAPYTCYISKNSAELLRNMNGEVGKIIAGTILPFLDVTLHMIMFTLIIASLFMMEPLITIIVIVMMGGGGYLFLRFTQKKTFDSGRTSREARGDMNRMVLQGLGGIKDARVLNREKREIERASCRGRVDNDAG